MAERTDSQFAEIGVREAGQDRDVNVVFGECGRVLPEPERLQPFADFRPRAARWPGLCSIFLVRFHGCRHPSPARLSTRPSLRSDRNLTHARSSSAAASRPKPTTSAARMAASFPVSLMARPCETQSSTKTRRNPPGLDPDQYRGKTTQVDARRSARGPIADRVRRLRQATKSPPALIRRLMCPYPGQPLAPGPPMVHMGAGGWRRTYRSPTGSGPEGSSPNETGRVFVQPPTFALICRLHRRTNGIDLVIARRHRASDDAYPSSHRR